MFAVSLPLRDAVSQMPLVGISARLCRKLDIDCANPLDETDSNEQGMLEFQLPAGFDGYAELNDPAIVPALYFFSPPVRSDQTMPAAHIAGPLVVAGLVQQAGGSFGEEYGLLVLTTEDCQGAAAPGIRYESPQIDDDTRAFYSIGGLPTTSSTGTDETGYGGLLNLNAGTVTVSGVVIEEDETVATLSLLSRAGSVTYARMAPDGS